MFDISFFHIASIHPKATLETIKNVRQHHPNNFYFLGVDGVGSYEYIAEEYNLSYRFYMDHVGGPVGDYGYRLNGVLEFLTRFREACLKCGTSHIMMLEDDVLITKPVTIEKEWEMACHYISHGNKLHPVLLEKIQNFTGKECSVDYYGAGGGSIFSTSTFLSNYNSIVSWFKENFDEVQKVYPTIGYIDCFMVVYYLLCGRDYTVNPHLTDTHHHYSGYDYDGFVKNISDSIQIVNNYKKYYYE